MTGPNYGASHSYSKPPRGYCTQISRAISPNSRCYEHLLVQGAANKIGAQNSWNRRSIDNRLNSKKIRESPDGTQVVGNVYGSHGKTKWVEQEQQTRAAEKRVFERGGLNEAEASREEELVYVRLETTGSNLADLSTSVINEKLVLSLFSQLLVENPSPASNKINSSRSSNNNNNNNSNNNNNNDSNIDTISKDIDQIKAQILSPQSSEKESTSKIIVPERCRFSMEKFLCRLIYPSCHFRRSDVSALVRPPCREDCLLLKDVLCSNLNWLKFTRSLNSILNATLMSMINELDLENQGVFGSQKSQQQGVPGLNTSSNHFYWPHEHSIERCEMLPPLRSIHFDRYLNKHLVLSSNQKPYTWSKHIRNQSRPRWPICSNAYLTRIGKVPIELNQANITTTNSNNTSITSQNLSKDQDCMKSIDGVDYMGQVNITRSGRACQLWQSQWPHSHASSEMLFDNMKQAQNYCRNPGGIEVKPWCYTQDPFVRWEYCDVQTCRPEAIKSVA